MRFLPLGWCAALAAVLVGCGGQDKPDAKPGAGKAATSTTATSTTAAATTAVATTAVATAAVIATGGETPQADGTARPAAATAQATPAAPPKAAPAPAAAQVPAAAPAQVAAPAAQAAEAGKTPPFFAPDFIAVVHLRPAKILETPLLKKLLGAFPTPEKPTEEDLKNPSRAFEYKAALERKQAIDRVASLEDVWVYVDPSPMGKAPVGALVVLQAKGPLDAKAFGEEWLGTPEWTQAEVEGKKFMTAPAAAEELGSPLAVHQADPKTLVAGPEDLLLRSLVSKPGPSPLADLVAKEKFDGQFTLVAVPGPFKPLLEKAKEFLSEQPLTSPYSKLPPHLPRLEAAVLKLSLEGPDLVVLDVALDDEAAGAQLKETLEEVWKEGRTAVAFALQMAKDDVGPAAKALVKEVGEKLSVAQAAAVSTVRLGLPTKLEAAVDEAVADVVPRIRAAAQRAQRLNNLRQILLSIHNHEATHRKMPADVVSADGKPLLSWRVKILPYLEEQALFEQFKLDEPWDSETNKPLVAKMPRVFEVAGAKPGETAVFAFTGPGTAFPKPGEAATFAQIADGMSRTAALVAAKGEKAIPWSKPGDLEFDPEKVAALLEALPEKDVLVGMFDGSVHVWKVRPTADVLKAFITIGGGELQALE